MAAFAAPCGKGGVRRAGAQTLHRRVAPRENMPPSRRLAIALLFGLASAAHAQTPPANTSVCYSSSDPRSPAHAGADGMLLGGASDRDLTCSFTTTGGETLSYFVQSGEGWELKWFKDGGTTTVDSQPATLPSGLKAGTFDAPAGAIVILTVRALCLSPDPTSACSNEVAAAVGVASIP